MKKVTTVEEYIAKQSNWQQELNELRDLLLSEELEETVKWGTPVYTVEGRNVVGLGAFKNYVAIWFFQGGLLSDPPGKLMNAQEGKTKALRQWRFTGLTEIEADRDAIRAYVREAVANERAGRRIRAERAQQVQIPEELQTRLDNDPNLKERFAAFTPGKQREFAEYISEAKRPGTREKRLEKIIPLILEGIGLNDRYRK